MTLLYFILYLAAGVCFGLAAGKVVRKADFLALGLLCWVLVDMIQTAQRL